MGFFQGAQEARYPVTDVSFRFWYKKHSQMWPRIIAGSCLLVWVLLRHHHHHLSSRQLATSAVEALLCHTLPSYTQSPRWYKW